MNSELTASSNCPPYHHVKKLISSKAYMKSQTAFIFRKEGTKNTVAQPFINLKQHYPEVAECCEKSMGFAIQRLRFGSQLFC